MMNLTNLYQLFRIHVLTKTIQAHITEISNINMVEYALKGNHTKFHLTVKMKD